MTEFEPFPLPTMTPLEPDDILSDFAANDGAWLAEQATDLAEPEEKIYVLIHLDDGVLWARVERGKLIVPVAKDRNDQPIESCVRDWIPKLRTLTIQQCRLFGSKGELFIWRLSEGVWRGRKVLDAPKQQFIPEEQLLLGNRVVADLLNDFTAIREESTGLRQIVPLAVKADDDHRVALVVRHYLSEDGDGQAIIKCSRLVGLIPKTL